MATKNRAALASIGVRKSAANVGSKVDDAENKPAIACRASSSSILVAGQQKEMKRKQQSQMVPSKCRTSRLGLPVNTTKSTVTRVALGQLANNVRVGGQKQPAQRKQSVRQSPAARKQGGFTIHLDVEENIESSSGSVKVPLQEGVTSPPSLHEKHDDGEKAVVGVRDRSALTTLNLGEDNLKESPMVCDVSTASERLIDEDKENEAPSSTDVASTYSSQDAVESAAIIVEDSVTSLYSADIYAYLRRLELTYRPKAKYMLKQGDITHGMRSILVDWLVEVVEEYRLQPETLFLAVSYIDRFLSRMSVLRTKLQLVGTAAVLVAAKFEEIYPPEIEEFVYITDDTYTKQQVLRMEQVILRVLSFGLANPTIHYFVNRYCIMGRLNGHCRNLAMYLSELSLLEADPYLQFVPSVIAGTAVCLACHTLDLDPWNAQLESQSGYVIDDFGDCLALLYKTYVNAPHYQQQSIREKYKGKKYSEVANIVPPVNLPI